MSSDPTPPSSGPRIGRNAGTIVPPAMMRPLAKPGVVDLAHAYETARGVAAMTAPRSPTGHRLFWMRGADFAVGSLEGEHYAVVGRHTHADIVIAHDPAIALRHLLLRSVTLPDGAAGLHVLDLRSSIGIELADGTRPRAIFARGAVAIRIGEYAFVALPNGVEAPEKLPQVDVDEAAVLPLSPYRGSPQRAAAQRFDQDHAPHSQITILPPISVISERQPQPEPSYGDRTLTLERDQQRVTVHLSEAELDAGVLIGRAEKCFDMGLRAVLSEDTNISRVHTLLLRERDAVFAFDLGSTQGTFTGIPPRRVRRVPLTNDGATLRLGHQRKHSVELYWHPLH